MLYSRSNYGQKDAPTPGQDTKTSAMAKPSKWRGPCFSRDATSSNKTDGQTTDTKKLTEAQPGSSVSNWGKQLMMGATAALLFTATRAQEVPTAPSTRDGHGNELVQRDVVHHSLEPRRVVGGSDSLPDGNRDHPDLPPLQVDGVKVPRLTINDMEAVLQRKELLKEISHMTQDPAFDKLLDKLAKNPAVIESLHPLCYMQEQDQEKVNKLLDNPECKKYIEDLASKPGFQAMVKAVAKDAFHQVLQEYDAQKHGENGEGPIKKKQKLWQAMLPVVGGVVVMGIACWFGRDRQPIDKNAGRPRWYTADGFPKD
jgi:hypothetical protein